MLPDERRVSMMLTGAVGAAGGSGSGWWSSAGPLLLRLCVRDVQGGSVALQRQRTDVDELTEETFEDRLVCK